MNSDDVTVLPDGSGFFVAEISDEPDPNRRKCQCESVDWNPYNMVVQCHRCGYVIQPPWLPIASAPKKVSSSILAFFPADEDGPYEIGIAMWTSDGCWMVDDIRIEEGCITHWMPLPLPPKSDVETKR